MAHLDIPEGALVLLVAPPAAGKSTFAAQHFLPTEIVSLDAARAWVTDDAGDTTATMAAVALAHQICRERLRRGRTTVLDATNLKPRDRVGLHEMARAAGRPRIALTFDVPLAECQRRNAARPRVVPPEAIVRMFAMFRDTLPRLATEGFAAVHAVDPAEDQVRRVAALPVDASALVADVPSAVGSAAIPTVTASGFDVVGDVHGCIDELVAALQCAGYAVVRDPATRAIQSVQHQRDPARRVAFVGDLVDRGPDALAVVRSVRALVAQGQAVCVQGNHDNKCARAMRPGSLVQRTHGLAETMAQFDATIAQTSEWEATRAFLAGLPSHAILQVPGQPPLVLAHAGLNPYQIGSATKGTRSRCLYGDVRGAPLADGRPDRSHAWTAQFADAAGPVIAYGHTPLPGLLPDLRHETINLDTGVPFGGRLSVWQWPARTLVQVPALRPYVSWSMSVDDLEMDDEAPVSTLPARVAALVDDPMHEGHQRPSPPESVRLPHSPSHHPPMTTLSDLFPLADLETALRERTVGARPHPTEPLTVLNYTDRCQYEPGLWNAVTRQCRGLIHDATGRVLARPFAKFFNHGQSEADALDLSAPALTTDKMDGSLGILYPIGNGYAVSTRGSFESEQAVHATAVWQARYAHVIPPAGWTMLFEIVFPENRIVLDYGDTDDLVLLGAVHIASGRSVGPTDPLLAAWPGPRTRVFAFATLAEALAADMRPNAEGLVVHLVGTEQRVKLKQADYVALHKIVTGLNDRVIWEHLAAGAPIEDLLAKLPDEFHPWVRTVATGLTAQVEAATVEVEAAYAAIALRLPVGFSRKEFAGLAVASSWRAELFNRLDGRSYQPSLWTRVRPLVASNLRSGMTSETIPVEPPPPAPARAPSRALR